MKRSLLTLLALILVAGQAFAQLRTITGKVTSEQGAPRAGVLVAVKGTIARTATDNQGNYSIRAGAGQVLQFSYIGTALVERVVGADDVIDVVLRRAALDLDAVLVRVFGYDKLASSVLLPQHVVPGPELARMLIQSLFYVLSGSVG